MLKKVLFVSVILLFSGGLLLMAMNRKSTSASDEPQVVEKIELEISEDAPAVTDEAGCPDGYYQIALLQPARGETEGSTSLAEHCKSIAEDMVEVVLEPIRPGDIGWEVQPYEPTEESEIVMGLNRERGYRCVILLEPIQPGEEASRSSDPVCAEGEIDSIDGVSLSSTYAIAHFYDETSYETLLVIYQGTEPCSSSASYGVLALPENLDNRFSSGKSFSNCNVIHVHQFYMYGGPTYTCGPNCPNFFALNNLVSSWRVHK
jgi:hypothetical protein